MEGTEHHPARRHLAAFATVAVGIALALSALAPSASFGARARRSCVSHSAKGRSARALKARYLSHRHVGHCATRRHARHNKSRLATRQKAGTRTARNTPPTPPANLSATPGDPQIALSWEASSDDVGVAGYRVYRDGVRVARTTGTSYLDVGLIDGSRYSYYVVAYDAAGRVSSHSNTVSATPIRTTSIAPTVPTGPTGPTGPSGSSGPPGPSGPASPTGPTHYVSTSGSDSNPGTLAAPWRTVGHAAALAGAGSTVLIEAGSYPEDVKLTASGAAGNPITFKANGSEAVSVQSFNVAGSHLAVENLTISGASGNCVTIQPALSDVTIQGDQIVHCGRDGIHFVRPGNPPSSDYTTNSLIAGNVISDVGLGESEANDMTIYADYLTVQGNDMSGTPNDAIDMWGDHLSFRQNNIHDISNSAGNHDDAFQTWTGLNDGSEGNPVTNLLVEQNRITNILGSNAHGFMLEGPGHDNWTVRENIFENIGSTGMLLGITGSGSSQQNLDVYNNTFYDAGANADIEFNSADTGICVDNILHGGGGIDINAAATVIEGYNLLYETSVNTGGGVGDITANPDFVNAPAGDFHLASDSPAINSGDAGSIISPVGLYDFEGNPVVGLLDRGAYEYR